MEGPGGMALDASLAQMLQDRGVGRSSRRGRDEEGVDGDNVSGVSSSIRAGQGEGAAGDPELSLREERHLMKQQRSTPGGGHTTVKGSTAPLGFRKRPARRHHNHSAPGGTTTPTAQQTQTQTKKQQKGTQQGPKTDGRLELRDLPKLKTFQIKAALQARGLPASGLRHHLMRRLETAVAEELSGGGIGNDVEGEGPNHKSSTQRQKQQQPEAPGQFELQAIKADATTMEIKLSGFQFRPMRVRAPIGILARWVVDEHELGMVEYNVILQRESRDGSGGGGSEESATVLSPALERGMVFEHRFMETGVLQVTDANYPDMVGTVEVYSTPDWHARRAEIERRSQAHAQGASNNIVTSGGVVGVQDLVRNARERAEKLRKLEKEKKLREEAAARDEAEEMERERNPEYAEMRDRQRSEAISASRNMVSGGWRSRLSEKTAQRKQRRAQREEEEAAARMQKEAEEQAAAARAKVEAEAEEARRREREQEQEQQCDDVVPVESQLHMEERGVALFPSIHTSIGGGVGEVQEEEHEGATAAILKPRRPPGALGDAEHSAAPSSLLHSRSLRSPSSHSDGSESTKARGGNLDVDAHAQETGGLEDGTTGQVEEELGTRGEEQDDEGQSLGTVHLEDCKATPEDLEVGVGESVTFQVACDEPAFMEYMVVISPHVDGSADDAGEDGAGEEGREEPDAIASSETLQQGDAWSYTFNEPGVFVARDSDYEELRCVIRVR